jgi:hypothetical protein
MWKDDDIRELCDIEAEEKLSAKKLYMSIYRLKAIKENRGKKSALSKQ